MRACMTAAVIFLSASSSVAWAQQQNTTQTSTTPVRVERVENRFLLSPDYKVTRLDGDTGQLAGVSAGYLIEDLYYIGGAGYWLASGASAWDLAYGGVVAGVRFPMSDRIAFGVKGLAGVGTATLRTTFGDVMPGRDWSLVGLPTGHGGRWHMPAANQLVNVGDTRVEVSDTFFVFEPQADVVFAITKRIRFGLAGGYHSTNGVEPLGDRLNGATATVSIQFGIGGR